MVRNLYSQDVQTSEDVEENYSEKHHELDLDQLKSILVYLFLIPIYCTIWANFLIDKSKNNERQRIFTAISKDSNIQRKDKIKKDYVTNHQIYQKYIK